MADEFTPDERAALAPYFTTLDGPVFALVNLPEVVKGALFARYSRSPKSLRRLFLDEFAAEGGAIGPAAVATAGTERAEPHYGRILAEHGDGSGAQVGRAHLAIRARACEALRGLLPAATRSNVGMFATAQSYEQLILRMRAHPLAEVRAYAELILDELRKVIPAFLTRLDRPERGGAWIRYL